MGSGGMVTKVQSDDTNRHASVGKVHSHVRPDEALVDERSPRRRSECLSMSTSSTALHDGSPPRRCTVGMNDGDVQYWRKERTSEVDMYMGMDVDMGIIW